MARACPPLMPRGDTLLVVPPGRAFIGGAHDAPREEANARGEEEAEPGEPSLGSPRPNGSREEAAARDALPELGTLAALKTPHRPSE